MKLRKCMFACCVLILGICNSLSYAADLNIDIYHHNNPPFIIKQHNKLVGFDIVLGETIAKQLDMNPHIVPMDSYDAMVDDISQNKNTIGMGLFSSKKHLTKINLSVPYLSINFALVASRFLVDFYPNPTSLFKKLKKENADVGTLSSDVYIHQLANFVSKQRIKIYPTPTTLFDALVQTNNNTKAIFINRDSAIYWLYAHPIFAVYYNYTIPNKSTRLTSSIGVNQHNILLLHKINAIISSMKADGTLAQMRTKYLKEHPSESA